MNDVIERAAIALDTLTQTMDTASHTLTSANRILDDPEMQNNLKRTIAASGLVMLAKTGHVVNLEEPALFNQMVGDFLDRVEAGRWPTRDPRTIAPKP